MTSITNLLLPILNIAISDIVLAADNAVVIAMMVLSLPLQQRRQGILFGTLAAVILRIVLTFGVSQLLAISGLKLVGGALILWIAWKVLTANSDPEQHAPQPAGLIRAVFMILLADITMSLDSSIESPILKGGKGKFSGILSGFSTGPSNGSTVTFKSSSKIGRAHV